MAEVLSVLPSSTKIISEGICKFSIKDNRRLCNLAIFFSSLNNGTTNDNFTSLFMMQFNKKQ
jgi:hypothetical protein